MGGFLGELKVGNRRGAKIGERVHRTDDFSTIRILGKRKRTILLQREEERAEHNRATEEYEKKLEAKDHKIDQLKRRVYRLKNTRTYLLQREGEWRTEHKRARKDYEVKLEAKDQKVDRLEKRVEQLQRAVSARDFWIDVLDDVRIELLDMWHGIEDALFLHELKVILTAKYGDYLHASSVSTARDCNRKSLHDLVAVLKIERDAAPRNWVCQPEHTRLRRVLRNHGLTWDEWNLMKRLTDVRNNLFHGLKFPARYDTRSPPPQFWKDVRILKSPTRRVFSMEEIRVLTKTIKDFQHNEDVREIAFFSSGQKP